ncbi:MAG: hypothetical protein IJW75_03330 [Alphaproteobacteria bacterium]|nr:hypothetical protein [Alphaproteobacteria bacterium]
MKKVLFVLCVLFAFSLVNTADAKRVSFKDYDPENNVTTTATLRGNNKGNGSAKVVIVDDENTMKIKVRTKVRHGEVVKSTATVRVNEGKE